VQLAVPQVLVGYEHALLAPSHLPAQVASVAVHAACPVFGDEPAVRALQVPVASQASQESVQALSQQMPSGEQDVPAAQPPPTAVHDWPSLPLQAPVLSQVPVHRPVGSACPLIATQVLVASQVMQLPLQSLATQQAAESMHLPLQDFFPEGHPGASGSAGASCLTAASGPKTGESALGATSLWATSFEVGRSAGTSARPGRSPETSSS
jgi:hypothetical protein